MAITRPVYYIGIDPGMSRLAPGGIAILHPNGEAEAWRMPATTGEILALLRKITNGRQCDAAIEHVWGNAKFGSSSSFKLGHNCGELYMALASCNIIPRKVTPQVWQKYELNKTKKGKDTKKLSLDVARKRYKDVLLHSATKDHGKSDALHLANYLRNLAN